MARWTLPAWTKRRWVIGAAVGTLVLCSCLAGCGPLIRSRVVKEASRRGLHVRVGRVSPGWWAVRLEDVSVTPEGTEGIAVHLDEVDVKLDGLSVGRLAIRGGHADLTGDVVGELGAWRGRHASPVHTGNATPITVEGFSLTWNDDMGDKTTAFRATGISLVRSTDVTMSADEVVAVRTNQTIGFSKLSLTMAHSQLVTAHVEEAHVAIELGASPAAPLATDHNERFHALLVLPDLHVLRALLQNIGARVASHVQDGLHVGLDDLTVTLTRGTEKLDLGPGVVGIDRKDGDVLFTFSAGAEAQTPLMLKANVPLAMGDAVLSLSGGPVALSMLGVREGAFGLVDPEHAGARGHARVVLDDAGKTLTFDGDLAVSGLSIHDARLATETVRGLDVRLSARGVLDDSGSVRLDDAEAQLGALHVRTHGGFEQTSDHMTASLSFELPVAGCQSLLESVPAALLPHVGLARFKGTLGATGFLSFDTRKIEELVLKYDVDDLCRVASAPDELKKDHFEGPFTYSIIDRDGNPDERDSGPGSDDWSPLETISPMMQVAVLTTEDGAFFHHHGFNTWAIRSALIADIKAGRFVRGASTITMQLAKNLFLSREKTLSRKLEEIILADYLERTFHKDELMELYLNVIEFGPDIYGIRAAAEHYFGRKPSELNLAESLFLSSLLPRPREAHKMYEKGEVPPHVMSMIYFLMDAAHRNARISDKELEEGKAETVVLHKADDPPPPPRPPVTSSQLTGQVWRTRESDDTWQTN